MDENEITQRLRQAGEQPVPGGVRADHLSRMHAAAPVVQREKRFGRLAVAAAAFVGFAVGSTGFAMAGALPAPAQGMAHDVLSVVQVDVPDRPDNRGRCVSAAARANRQDEVAKQAAKDACPKGKPAHAGQGKPGPAGKGKPAHAGAPGGPNGRPDEGDPCKGPPPWAGKGAKDMTPEDRRARQQERAAACGRSVDDDQADEQADVEEREAPETEGTEAPAAQEGEVPEQAPPAGTPQPPAEQAPQPELPEPLDPAAGEEDPAAG